MAALPVLGFVSLLFGRGGTVRPVGLYAKPCSNGVVCVQRTDKIRLRIVGSVRVSRTRVKVRVSVTVRVNSLVVWGR